MTDVKTGTLTDRALETLRAIVAKYSHAEAEVVRAYFAKPRTPEEHT